MIFFKKKKTWKKIDFLNYEMFVENLKIILYESK
jgi:hypothetical protein